MEAGTEQATDFSGWSVEELRAELADACETIVWAAGRIGLAVEDLNAQVRRTCSVYGQDRYGSWPAGSLYAVEELTRRVRSFEEQRDASESYATDLKAELWTRVQS